MIFWFLFLWTVTSFQIENMEIPSCHTCKYFEPNSAYQKESRIRYGKCKYFGKKDLIQGTIVYKDAYEIRFDENMCGQKGLFYKKDKHIWKHLHIHSDVVFHTLLLSLIMIQIIHLVYVIHFL